MNDTLGVRMRERRSDLPENGRGGLRIPGAIPHLTGECSAPHQLHDEVGALVVPPEVVERDDVGMFQLRHLPGVRLESTHEGRLVRQLGSDHPDGDLPPNRRLVGAVHRPGPAEPEPPPELVPGEAAQLPPLTEVGGRCVEPKLRELGGEANEHQLAEALGGSQAAEAIRA